MIRKVLLVSISMTLLVTLFLAAYGHAAATKPVTWVFATSAGSSSNTWAFAPYPRFQKMVEKATGGRLILNTKVDLFPATEVIHGIIQGRADIGFQRIPWVSGTFPQWDFGSLPFFFDNYFEYESTLNDPRMIKILEKTYADAGLFYLMESFAPAPDGIFGKKAIATVDEFKGVKIRTAGMLPTFTLKLLGAHPLTMAMTEIDQALARGVVDAVQTGAAFALGFGLVDITTHVSFWTVQSTFPGSVVINKKSWDALPADLKKIVVGVAKEMQAQTIYASNVEYIISKKACEAAKLKVITPEKKEVDKAREMARPAIDEWLKVAGPYGPQILAIAGEYAGGAKIMLHK